MDRKRFATFMVIAIGIFTASSARADLGDFYFNRPQALPGKAQDFYFAIINNENDSCSEDPFDLGECHAGMAAKLRFGEWDKREGGLSHPPSFIVSINLHGKIIMGLTASAIQTLGFRPQTPDYFR